MSQNALQCNKFSILNIVLFFEYLKIPLLEIFSIIIEHMNYLKIKQLCFYINLSHILTKCVM